MSAVLVLVLGSTTFAPMLTLPLRGARVLYAPAVPTVLDRYRYVGRHRLRDHAWQPGELTRIAAELDTARQAREAEQAARLERTEPITYLFTHLSEVARG